MSSTSSHPLVRATQALERSSRLDPLVGFYQPLVDGLVAGEGRRKLLQGDWLGHAVHPVMTDVPIGMWTSATVLDLVGGERSRPAAELLVAGGLAASLPTALAGWAEWHRTGTAEKRVGVVHALSNVAAIGLYSASLVARRRDRHLGGVLLGLAAGSALGVGGYLGGHLAAARKVSSRHPDFEADGLA